MIKFIAWTRLFKLVVVAEIFPNIASVSGPVEKIQYFYEVNEYKLPKKKNRNTFKVINRPEILIHLFSHFLFNTFWK